MGLMASGQDEDEPDDRRIWCLIPIFRCQWTIYPLLTFTVRLIQHGHSGRRLLEQCRTNPQNHCLLPPVVRRADLMSAQLNEGGLKPSSPDLSPHNVELQLTQVTRTWVSLTSSNQTFLTADKSGGPQNRHITSWIKFSKTRNIPKPSSLHLDILPIYPMWRNMHDDYVSQFWRIQNG